MQWWRGKREEERRMWVKNRESAEVKQGIGGQLYSMEDRERYR